MMMLKRKYTFAVYTVFILLSLLNLKSCTNRLPGDQPNIVWIVSEDNSKQYLNIYDAHGVATPNIDHLASMGIQFNNTNSNAPVCSVARSTLISSCYAPRIGAQFHRKYKEVPMPDGLRMFPAYLRDAGYYTSNNAKEDYNIVKTDDVWDESSKKASWRNRKEGQPFFHVQNIGTTHEGQLHFTKDQMNALNTITNPDTVFVPPYHPDTEIFRYSYASYYDKMVTMDKEVGEIVKALDEDGLLENTIIFYYGDNGGILPGSKGYLKEQGVDVPLVVYIPEKYSSLSPLKPGSKTDGFVSFVDFGATVLNLAGVEIPEQMDGKPFLGRDITLKSLANRDEAYSYADRFDEKYDLVRALQKGKYKYIRNFQPFNIDGLQNNYRYHMLAYREWRKLYEEGELNESQSRFFRPKPVEELYDLESDPYELVNLASDPEFSSQLEMMRKALNNKMLQMPDLSL